MHYAPRILPCNFILHVKEWNLHLSTHKFYNRFIEAILKLHEDPFCVKWVEKVLKEIALLLVFIASSILSNVMLYNRISAISKRTINRYLHIRYAQIHMYSVGKVCAPFSFYSECNRNVICNNNIIRYSITYIRMQKDIRSTENQASILSLCIQYLYKFI